MSSLKVKLAAPALAAACLFLPLRMAAVNTQQAAQFAYDHFEDGRLENIAIPAEGGLKLAPSLERLARLDASVIWRAVADKDGTLYVGTGNAGKVFKVSRDGKAEAIFQPEEVLTRALALDSKGNLYIGTSPDGRVYRIAPGGRPEIYFDPAEIYIWDLKFDAQGRLYVATGAKGRVYRLPPDYQSGQTAEVFFESDRTHIFSLAFDHDGRLLAGAGPKSLLYRVAEKDKATVLASVGSDEITSINPAANGDVFVTTFNKGNAPATGSGSAAGTARSGAAASSGAGSGTSSSSSDLSGDESPLSGLIGSGSSSSSGSGGGTTAIGSGRSQLLRISTDGFVEPVWSLARVGLFSVRPLADGRWLLGSDQHGRLFSAGSPQDWELTQEVPDSSEVSQLLPAPDDPAATLVFSSNPAQIYRLSAKSAAKGVYICDPFDGDQASRWGTIRALARPPLPGETLAGAKWETRTGNTPKPDLTWSQWQSVGEGGKVNSPAGRYFEYRVTLTDAARGIRSLDVYYTHFNAPPVVAKVGVLPMGVEVLMASSPRPSIDLRQLTDGEPSSLLGPLAARPQLRPTGEAGGYSIGWRAADPNGDLLQFMVQLRTVGEAKWVTLADELSEPIYSFSSRGFTDGYYEVRITATDKLDNPPGEGRTGERVSAPFLIDNSPPEISLDSQSGDANSYTLTFKAHDAVSVLDHAQYTVDGLQTKPALPEGGLFDKQDLTFKVRLERLKSGAHSVVFEVTDSANNTGAAKATFETP